MEVSDEIKEKSACKILLEEFGEEKILMDQIPMIMEYLLPKKTYKMRVIYQQYGQHTKEIIDLDDFMRRHSTFGFSLVTIDTLKLSLQFDDMEKSIEHIFKVPNTRHFREKWMQSFESTISNYYQNISNLSEISDLHIMMHMDQTNTFQFVTSLIPREESYTISIRYKMTKEWVHILLQMIEFFKIIRSFEV